MPRGGFASNRQKPALPPECNGLDALKRVELVCRKVFRLYVLACVCAGVKGVKGVGWFGDDKETLDQLLFEQEGTSSLPALYALARRY